MLMNGDNTGLILRCGDSIKRVLITLDVTSGTIDEAKELGCDMILSHHPAFFKPVRALDFHNASDAIVMKMIKEGISLYAAHTSFDRANGGMGDVLASKLKLKNIETVAGCGEYVMKTGYLKRPLSSDALVIYIKEMLEINSAQISYGGTEIIEKLAIVGGSGGDFINAAKKSGAKALLTGEAKHHHYIEAAELGILLITAGHYETERYFTEKVFMSLQSCVNELQLSVELIKTRCGKSPRRNV